MAASTATAAATAAINHVVVGRPTWQQTMLRIKDPSKSIRFYTDIMGMTVIDSLDFPQWSFKIFFLTTLKEDEKYTLTPGTQEAHDYMWSIEGTCLELTYNYGTDEQDDFKYHAGNQEKDGFGHIAFNTDDVYDACKKLEQNGVHFKKKPDEGRMKGIAFAYDPDGYWVEIVKRSTSKNIPNYFNFSQTMLRIKDPAKSIPFYEAFGMTVVRQKNYGDFSNYFLASSPNVDDTVDYSSLSDDEAKARLSDMFGPVLELTHNHGTENDADFRHSNGNEDGKKGFGHVGFLVDDVYAACDSIREMGYGFMKEPDGGTMKGLAFAYDPDGYLIEIIKRGGIDFGDKKVET
jgi:lactoylglutathione lyase